MKIQKFTVGAVFVVGSLVAACSGSAAAVPTVAPAASPMASPSMMTSASPMASPAAMTAPFGSACSAVPASGAGSFDGMSTAAVATAASSNPVLTTLVSAVTAAGLGDTLNSAKAITVFAPSDAAFKAFDQATLTKAMADPKGLLTTVLTYHVIGERLSPDKLAGTHKTLEGQDVVVTGSGTSFTINGKAMVVCGNVQTANATVYIIDSVLVPPAK